MHKVLYSIRELVTQANVEVQHQGLNIGIINQNLRQANEKVDMTNKELTQANKGQKSVKNK